MRYRDGAPLKLYAITWQETGESNVYTTKKLRDYMLRSYPANTLAVRATYALVRVEKSAVRIVDAARQKGAGE